MQQLQVWTPGELEMVLFAIYSPVHALLWMAFTSANWIIMAAIMGVTSMHVSTLYSPLLSLSLRFPLLTDCSCDFLFPCLLPGMLFRLVGWQIRALIQSFEALQKDRAIISAEVLHEYDEKVSFPLPCSPAPPFPCSPVPLLPCSPAHPSPPIAPSPPTATNAHTSVLFLFCFGSSSYPA